MESHDGMHFCDKEHKFAQIIFNNTNSERLTNQQLDSRIRCLTRNNTNITYNINESRIKRIIKYITEFKDNLNKWHHEDEDFKEMNNEYNNDTTNDPEIDEDERPIRTNYFTRIHGRNIFNEELSEENEYEELTDLEEEDPELREARLLSTNQDNVRTRPMTDEEIRKEMEKAKELVKKRNQGNIAFCKECLMPKEQNEKGYCEDCQKEIDAKAVNLAIEKEPELEEETPEETQKDLEI